MKIGLGIGLVTKTLGGGAIPPVNTVAPVISGTTTLGSTLTSTTGTWTGIPAPTFTYQWYRGATLISGATNNTYVTVLADSTASITCRVTGTNIAGSSVAISNALTMDNYAPANSVAPVISGTAVVGQTLTTTDGTWSNSPSFSYQWKRGATNIGTNSSTYTLVAADAGNASNITCVVTATNSAGSANATSNQIAQILTVRTSAFLTASAISDATIRGGLNTFDIGLISNSLDTKMKAVYPFVGGTASTHKFNFMNSADTDAAFRLAFSGTWVHSSTGATPNGINGYADTFLVPSSVQNVNSNGIGAYITPFTVSGGDATQMGAINSGTQRTFFAISPTAMLAGANGSFASSTISGNEGHFSVQKTSSTVTTNYKNSTLLTNFNSGGTLPNLKMFIGTGSLAGNVPYTGGYSNSQFRLAYISDGLNSSEITAFYNLIQAFQTTLGRQVGVPIVSDSDAQAFLNAAEITNTTQADAVNTLVIGMKAQGLWTKMRAIYPLVGGTASAHKFNLKDPRDLDAAFRLAFIGGWTHDSTGILSNGTNAYANTFFTPVTQFSSRNSLSIIANISGGTLLGGSSPYTIAGGGANINLDETGHFFRATGKLSVFTGEANSILAVSNSTTTGYSATNSLAGATSYVLGTSTIATGTVSASGSLGTFPLFISAVNIAGTPFNVSYQNVKYNNISFGDGLTLTEHNNYRTLINTFNTSIGR